MSATKKNKKKGPFRTEAILTIIVVIILVTGYSMLFLDTNLKQAISWGLTYANKAEVNISSIKTNFSKPSLSIYNIQVTDRDNPSHNLVQIEHISLSLLWDSLLRGKIVVPTATVTNVAVNSLRKSKGRVLTQKEAAAPEIINNVKDKALEQSKEKFNDNIIGDLASIASGTNSNDQAVKITETLSAEKKLKNLESELKQKEIEWNNKFKELPQAKEFDALKKRGEKLKFDSKNPIQFAKDLSELNSILKSADKKVQTYKTAANDLKKDIKHFETQFNNIDKWVEEDIETLQNRLKIPNIKGNDFSKDLFGKILESKLGKYKKYLDMAKEYMPPPKSERVAEDNIVPKQRGQGLNIKFPITTSYPLFWLKKAEISSVATENGFSGNLEGIITDLTSTPTHIKKPTRATLSGDFPNQKVTGIKASLVLDHTKSPSKDTFNAIITEFPVTDYSVSSSNDVKLKVKTAIGSSSIQGELTEGILHVSSSNRFTKMDYDLQASSKSLQKDLESILSDIPVVTLNTKAKGNFPNLKWNINSNIGKELSKGFKKKVQQKIDAKKLEIKKQVESKISAQRQEIEQQLAKVKADFNKKFSKQEKEIKTAKTNASSKLTSKKTTANKKADSKKAEAKKKIEAEKKKLLKKLGL